MTAALSAKTKMKLALISAGLRLAAVVLIVSVSVLRPAGCRGDDQILGPAHGILQMPSTGANARGFKTLVEMAAENSVGYIPVKITVNAVGTFTAERRFTYRFATTPSGQLPPRNGLVVEVPITVAQGSKSQTVVRYLPKWSAGQSIEVSVWEDGLQLPYYNAHFGMLSRPATFAPIDLLKIEHQINWVYISPNNYVTPQSMPDLRAIGPVRYPDRTATTQAGSTSVDLSIYWSQVMNGAEFLALGQRDLPCDWRAYQRYDAIAIGSEALQRLRTREVEFTAIRDWVLNGGTIVVYDAVTPEPILQTLDFTWNKDEEATNRLVQITAQLNLEIDSRETRLKGQLVGLRADLERDKAIAKAYANPNQALDEGIQYSEAAIKEVQDELAWYTKARAGEIVGSPIYSVAEWNDQIWMQPAGAGMVMGILASDRYEIPPPAHWQIVTGMIDHRISPMLRRGVDPLIGSRRFANWLIPGVAEPPVYTFMGLLTCFVVLVGPVAYRRTAKLGRSYLMFGIAPILALVTTLAMFGYGILADGFGTVVRVRQLTWIDGQSGDAAERVRATYFAGVRPEKGLRFPGNAEVSGYPEGSGQSWEDLNKLSPATIGRLSIQPETQWFDSSFLPSRQQRQFVSHTPRKQVGSIELMPAIQLGSPPTVQSTLGFPVRDLVIRDQRGKYWFLDELEPGPPVACTPLSTEQASKRLGQLYTDHRPMSQVRESRRTNRYSSHTYDVLVSNYRRINTKKNVTDGLFEQWLREHMQTSGEIPRRNFVAIADVSRDSVAVDECELVGGIRYVFGTLR